MEHRDLPNTMGGLSKMKFWISFPPSAASKTGLADFIPQTKFFRQALGLVYLAFHDDPIRKDSSSIQAIFPAFHDGINNSSLIEAKGITRKETPQIEPGRIFLTETRQILQSLIIKRCNLFILNPLTNDPQAFPRSPVKRGIPSSAAKWILSW